MKRRALLALLALLVPSLSLAQSAVPAGAGVPDAARADAHYPDVTHIDFTDLAVRGDVVRPAYGYVVVPGRLHFPSMAKVRVHFDDELAASVDLVK